MNKLNVKLWLKWSLMSSLGLIFICPLLFMVFASFKSDSQIFSQQSILHTFNPFNGVGFKNYQDVLGATPFVNYLTNSLVVTFCSVIFSVLINSMAAYALLRFPWRHKQVIFTFLLALLVIPFEAIILPLVFIVTNLPWLTFESGQLNLTMSWFNSLHVQIIPELANPFFIYLIYAYLKSLPKDYEEAALLEGASIWKIYFFIVHSYG